MREKVKARATSESPSNTLDEGFLILLSEKREMKLKTAPVKLGSKKGKVSLK